jgi:hypothetical protein
MGKKILIIFSIILFLGIFLFFVIKKPNFSPDLEECKTLTYNSEDAINILFFSPEEKAKEYSEFLFEIEPFSENKEKFNIFYIDSYEPKCEIYQEVALLCYNRELIKKSSSCPSDYIVVTKKEENKIRSSSYMNVISINEKHPLTVFPHELGHALAFLADEYVPAKLPSKSKNCVSKCDSFNGENCFEGCSKQDYYRSIESGIMKTLYSKKFGNFNSQLIINELPKTEKTITGKTIKDSSSCKEYHLIEGKFKEGKIELINITLEEGCIGKNGKGELNYRLIQKDSSIYLESEFNPEWIFTDNEEEGDVLRSETNFFLKIPSIENLKEIDIIKEEELIKKINLLEIDSRPCKK